MPTASPNPDLSAPPADSDPWNEQFEIAAEAGMEIGDQLAECGALDAETMRRLTELHEELEDAADIDEESKLTGKAASITRRSTKHCRLP